MAFQRTTFETITINVDERSAVQFAYTDSGAPLTGDRCYTTIIAIHGMCFAAPVFKRVHALAQDRGIRFVALNRRNYPGSTPYSEEETNVLRNGTKEERDAYLRNRGHEIALFIDRFIEKTDIAPIFTTTGGGGIALLAWSAGSGLLTAMIAHADTLPRPVQSRLSSYIRSLIFQESHGTQFGFSVSEFEFSLPRLVDHIPNVEERHKMFGQWVSGYFEHGDVSTRDRKVLSWVVPSTKRIGTIYNMTKEEQEEMLCLGYEATLDMIFMTHFGKQLGEVYRKTFFPGEVGGREPRLFKDLKITYFLGGICPAFAFDAAWNLEKDVKEAGSKGRRVDVRIVPETNHFTHWDDPEMALDVYLESA